MLVYLFILKFQKLISPLNSLLFIAYSLIPGKVFDYFFLSPSLLKEGVIKIRWNMSGVQIIETKKIDDLFLVFILNPCNERTLISEVLVIPEEEYIRVISHLV